jgi:phosphate-selective porin OprO/OprP
VPPELLVNRQTALLTLTVLAGVPTIALAQTPPPASVTQDAPPASQPPAIVDTMDASESDAPARRLVRFNEYEGPAGSIRLGFGFLYDYVTYDQDENSKEQFDGDPQWKMRDVRVLFSGRVNFKRPTTWSAGIMYDANKKEWLFRQTGIMVAVPEIWGHIFVGRTKEGFSLNKVMIGYAGWTHERAPMNDATLPILADGVKWLGYVPKARILWNLGFYGDALSEGQSFSSYQNQVSARFAWVPLMSPNGGTLLHIGIAERFGKVNNSELRLRARPGAWAAPYVVDTGQFAADSTNLTGTEVYFRPGSFTFGSEYFFQQVDAPESGNPFFHGGEVVATWLITGEVRTYNTRGGYFNQISPNRPVFAGGPGAWEIVAQFGTIDLDDGSISGGKYWRFTPMVNWYLTDHVRLETIYGYGSLNRYNLVGKTHFFQTRIQLQL